MAAADATTAMETKAVGEHAGAITAALTADGVNARLSLPLLGALARISPAALAPHASALQAFTRKLACHVTRTRHVVT